MSRSEIERYHAMLEAKKTELSFGLRSREDIAIEKTADTMDEVQFAGERELAIRTLDRESKLLRSICSALARIEDGSYGVCLRCDTAINPKRLGAVPWAAYCVRCQEEADRHGFESEVVLDAAYQAHPDRFIRRPPKPLPLTSEVWIDKPVPPGQKAEEGSQTPPAERVA